MIYPNLSPEEDRIALLLDYENLAIGARDKLGGLAFDFKPVAEALAERGRVVVRRAYADWSYFREDRRMLTHHNVELIDIPQRMGIRKNAADIKMAVDAMEICYARDYLTVFVIATGDSDFTPLVHKLRELNKRVIGVGVKASTSALLPSACDEFLFYESLEGVEIPQPARRRTRAEPARRGAASGKRAEPAPAKAAEIDDRVEPVVPTKVGDLDELAKQVTQTLTGLQRGTGDVVLASSLKRALLRKDPTFTEGDYGFRTWGELIRFLQERKIVDLSEGSAKGDFEVSLPEHGRVEEDSFALLRSVVAEMESKGTPPYMSGLKNYLRKRQPDFSEKRMGYNGFLQFCKAAHTRGLITLNWSDEDEDYVLGVPAAAAGA